MKLKNNPKKPLAMRADKVVYLRQDFVVESINDAMKVFVKDFKRQYLEHNIDEPSARGDDVDVRLEKSICELNCENIRHVCEYLAMYFSECLDETS